MKKMYLFLAVVTALASSCSKNNADPGPGEDLQLTADDQLRAEADNKFTLKLFKTLAPDVSKDSNMVFSPLSLSMAIAMTGNGSNGATLEGIRTAMEFTGSTEEQVNSYYNKLITKLPRIDPSANVKLANSIWYHDQFSVLPSFIEVNKTAYNAEVEKINFGGGDATGKINGWANQKTNGKIPKIVENIPANAIMYLINAIYFKAGWKYKFDKNKTQKAVFHTNNGDVQTDFMNIEASFNMAATSLGNIIELPYGNEKYNMVIILPAAGKTVEDVINNTDLPTWKSSMEKLQKQTIKLALPKFKIEFAKKLNGALAGLGMAQAFSPGADFTRINPGGGLSISSVIQKAFIEVNEEGTTAAAVTAVEIVFTSIGPGPLKVDRPFIFAIREKGTGLILFNGIVNNPLN